MFQCASGADWEDKLHTPSLEKWTKFIIFTSKPKKAFATPFAFLNEEFNRSTNSVNGILVDRNRILAPSRNGLAWVSNALENELESWINSRISTLPRR
jgi:hypothetical protein